MGRPSWFLRQLQSRGECYLLAVPSKSSVRDLAAPDPPYPGCGRPPLPPFGRADRWAARPEADWQAVEVRDAEKGPLVVPAARTLVQARADNRASEVAELLVVFRERQGDGTWRHDYLLSNAPLDTHPHARTSLRFSRLPYHPSNTTHRGRTRWCWRAGPRPRRRRAATTPRSVSRRATPRCP